MKLPPHRLPRALGHAFAVPLLAVCLQAQQAPTLSPKPADPSNAGGAGDEKAIELSPFEVRAEKDVGYQAANTTSGSRLNTRLKDTPAGIDPFTAEFLSDIAATSLSEMLAHAIDVEADVEDSIFGFQNIAGRDASGAEFPFRMRGMAGGVARDFVESGVPTDLYNVERADVASGPNSILFGVGLPGGTVALSGKRAALNRTKTNIKAIYGSWDLQRYELDTNVALVPRKLGVRLLALYQDAEGWRKWTFNDQKRISGALTYQPFKNTTVRLSGETGNSNVSTEIRLNAYDQISAWDAAGRPKVDGTVAVPGTTRFGAAATANRFTFSDNDGQVYDLRGKFFSAARGTNTLVTPDVMPYNYNMEGPGGQRYQSFKSQSVQVEQRLAKNIVVELALFHNDSRVTAYGTLNVANPVPMGGTIGLQGDPNLTLPLIGTTADIRNPRAGQLFSEGPWGKDSMKVSNDIARATASWEIDLGKWFGRHRLAGLLESAKNDRLRRNRLEILVDQNNVAISTANNPEAANNQLYRRHYFDERDFSNYYASDPRLPLPAITYIGGRQITPAFVTNAKGNTHTKKDDNSWMLASQSFWFERHLVTTLGYRQDEIDVERGIQARITDPNDSRVTSRRYVLNEWDFNGSQIKGHTAKTKTAGAVLHIPWLKDRLSVFYNTSSNVGAPSLDRTILPFGEPPPPTEGKGRDIGLMLDFFGDERFFLRVAQFKTENVNDANVQPNGLAVDTAAGLGGDNLLNIYNALLAANVITAAQYDAEYVTYNAATTTTRTTGTEVSFVANPTRNLTLRLAFSTSKRIKSALWPEIYEYWNTNIPRWRTLAGNNAALLNTINSEIDGVLGNPATGVIGDLPTRVSQQQNGRFGSRPYKLNATGRYKFSEGRLKGLFLGGSVRYGSKIYLQYNPATLEDFWGNETIFVDAFTGYRVKLPWTKAPLNLQLNVRNLTNSYLVGVGRLNDTFDGVRRVFLNDPRSYRLTASVDF